MEDRTVGSGVVNKSLVQRDKDRNFAETIANPAYGFVKPRTDIRETGSMKDIAKKNESGCDWETREASEFIATQPHTDIKDMSAISVLQSKTDTCENSVDPDKTPRDESSHQDLHCLPSCF